MNLSVPDKSLPKSPFVYRFSTERHRYLYDVNTNRVFRVDDVFYAIAADYGVLTAEQIFHKYGMHFSKDVLRTAMKEIDQAKREGLLSSHRPGKMEPHDDLEEALQEGVCEQLILGVTEHCNLRCGYCVYSEHYTNYRQHSKYFMSEQTAKDAVDFFLKSNPPRMNIAFYGGEPLVNFPLIVSVVEYAKKKADFECTFGLTTNGTLLGNEEIARFFIDNNFRLAVSLDGDAATHDRYRRFENGNGTHAIIYENLRRLRAMDEDYYQSKVVFSAVNAPPYRILTTLDYFSSEELLCGHHVTPAFLSRAANQFVPLADQDGRSKREGNLDELSRLYADCLLNGREISSMLHEIVGKYIEDIYERFKADLADLPLNGCCRPGLRRQFVNREGQISICEKMDGVHPVGNIYTGLDAKKVHALIDSYIQISEACLDCWACRLCTACFASAHDGAAFSEERKRKECDAVRHRYSEMLILYYSLLEENPTVFDFLSDHVMVH